MTARKRARPLVMTAEYIGDGAAQIEVDLMPGLVVASVPRRFPA
jgi:hypothetical protein